MDAVARPAGPQVDQSERAWWLRVVAVLQAPRSVFAALRDESAAATAARQEPVAAIVILAGIAGVLAGPRTGQLMDDAAMDGITAAVVVFLSGSLYGTACYWLGGLALQLASERLGSRGSTRRSRHVLAYAAVPLVVSLLLLWPVRLAVYGADGFRSGGADEGLGGHVFAALEWVFVAWAATLLVIGVRSVHGWTWARAAAAAAIAVALTGLLLVVIGFVLQGA